MVRGILRNSSPFVQLLFSAIIVIGSFLIILFIASLLAIPIFHLETEKLFTIIEDFNASENIGIMKYFQIWLSFGTFVIPAFVIAYFIHGNTVAYLRIHHRVDSVSIINVILVMIISIPMINLLAKWNAGLNLPDFLEGLESRIEELESRAETLTSTFLVSDTVWQYLVNLAMIAIIPAIGEELLFRGIVQRILIGWTKNNHIGILLAAAIFSAFHLQFYGFLPRLVLGIYFGYLFMWSRTIWLPICAHFVNNGIAVTVYFIYGKEFVEKDIDPLGPGKVSVLVYIITLLFAGLLTGYIYRNEKSRMVSEMPVRSE